MIRALRILAFWAYIMSWGPRLLWMLIQRGIRRG
jgi:hypothetical protein